MDKAKQVCRQGLAQAFPADVKNLFETYLKALEPPPIYEREPEKARQLEEECLGHLGKAMALRDAGKYKEAEKELEAASKTSPGGAWLYATLCRLGAERAGA